MGSIPITRSSFHAKANTLSDCIIVGAGAIGLLSALALKQRGCTVTVVDRRNAGREASWAGGGILCPLYPWRYHEAINRLAFWSAERYPAIAEDLLARSGIDPQWQGSGLLILDPPKETEVANWSERFEQPVEQRPASAIFPTLSVERAAWMPRVGQVRNPRLMQSLEAAARQEGIQLVENTRVESIWLAGDQARGLRMADGDTLAGDRVIVAAGAWSAPLVPGMPPDAIAPVRGQMLRLQAEPDTLPAILMDRGVYLIPRRDGGVIVGSTVEHVGFDRGTTEQARRHLHDSALRIWPALANAPITHHWSGLRPGSDNGVPSIGAHPQIENLFLNTGHYRNGLVMGPASAELLANLVSGEQPILDPAPCDPARRLV
ncbi:MAG: glycine oxidase ThiO [Halothiobacillaceae bacterium]